MEYILKYWKSHCCVGRVRSTPDKNEREARFLTLRPERLPVFLPMTAHEGTLGTVKACFAMSTLKGNVPPAEEKALQGQPSSQNIMGRVSSCPPHRKLAQRKQSLLTVNELANGHARI